MGASQILYDSVVHRCYRWLSSRSSTLAAWFLGLVLLLAATDKLFHLEGFYNAVASYALVPSFLETALPLPIILLEIVIGATLLTSRWRKPAAWATTALFAVFSIALAGNLFYEPGSVCGCWFTLGANTPSALHIAQNVAMLLLGLTIALDRSSKPSREAEGPLPAIRTNSLDT